MDSICRCEDCRQIVHGDSSQKCPQCGGTHLNRLVEHAGTHAHLHPPVLKLAIAFCIGLIVMQVVAFAMGLNPPPAGHGTPFWHLNLVIVICTALYIVLRRTEGDFRALFVTAFALFIFGEGLSILARFYGISALHNLSGVFRHAMLVFSSLTITAGAAEARLRSPHERLMLAASGGFLFLAALHLMLDFFKRGNDQVRDIATATVALGVLIFAATVLLRHRKKRDEKAPEPRSLL
jgi:hypothetical protein